LTKEVIIVRTVSRAGGRRPLLTKVLTRSTDGGWQKTNYDRAFEITAEVRSADSFDELTAILEEIKHDPHAMLIRGPLTETGREALARDPNATGLRRKSASPEWPNPWFEEGAVQWEMLDFDDLPTDGIDYIRAPESFVQHVIEQHLPDCYHKASCWWQFSSSAGTKIKAPPPCAPRR